MALDMNIDVGSLVKGLFSKKDGKKGVESAPNPYTKSILVVVAVFIFIALYVYLVYLPTQEDLRIKNKKIAQIESIKYEIDDLSANIEQIQKELIIAQAEYERRSILFYTDKELEDLYGQISLLAMKNKLTITKIEKGIERPIFSEGNCSNNSIDSEDEFLDEEQFFDEEMEGEGMLQNVGYYDFSVNLEITGNYTQFTNFRNGLAQLNKIVNINKETITVESESKGGDVKVAMIIATYRLPKNEAEQCADSSAIMNEEEF